MPFTADERRPSLKSCQNPIAMDRPDPNSVVGRDVFAQNSHGRKAPSDSAPIPAQIAADPGLEVEVFRLSQIVLQQDEFGGDGGVGLELEHPASVGPLGLEQRLPGAVHQGVDRRQGVWIGRRLSFVHGRSLTPDRPASPISPP